MLTLYHKSEYILETALSIVALNFTFLCSFEPIKMNNDGNCPKPTVVNRITGTDYAGGKFPSREESGWSGRREKTPIVTPLCCYNVEELSMSHDGKVAR